MSGIGSQFTTVAMAWQIYELTNSPLLCLPTRKFFWFSVLTLALCGAGDMISSILRSTANQLSTPDALRGRMSSINSIFTSSGPQLGQFESGLAVTWLSAKLSALTGGLATLAIVGIVIALFPQVHRFQISMVNGL